MKKIILDTNILMVPGKFKVDIFEEIDRIINDEYKLFTLDSVVDELKRLSKKKSKSANIAKLGLELLKSKNIDIIDVGKGSVDKQILDMSDKDTIVATNDTELKKRLKKKGIKTIYLRKLSQLELG